MPTRKKAASAAKPQATMELLKVVPMKWSNRYVIRVENEVFEMKLPEEIEDQFDVLIEQHGIPCDLPEGAYRKEVKQRRDRRGYVIQEVTLRQNGNTDAEAFLANRRRQKDEAAQKAARKDAANQGYVPVYADPNMAPGYLNKG